MQVKTLGFVCQVCAPADRTVKYSGDAGTMMRRRLLPGEPRELGLHLEFFEGLDAQSCAIDSGGGPVLGKVVLPCSCEDLFPSPSGYSSTCEASCRCVVVMGGMTTGKSAGWDYLSGLGARGISGVPSHRVRLVAEPTEEELRRR